MPVVNDVHSQLNPTAVRSVVAPRSVVELQDLVVRTRQRGVPLCVSGGRHAMGGQAFAADAVLVDTRSLDAFRRLDSARGLVEVEAGIQWPELVAGLRVAQAGHARPWAIAQKQTGADRFTIGGSLSANIHGRGLRMGPFVSDIEALTLVDARGDLVSCSRERNGELFRLAIGGYGLFGTVATVTLRLVPRRKLRRDVVLLDAGELMPAFDERIRAGFLYGDFQFAIDPRSRDFLRRGVFSCYQPVADDTAPPPDGQLELREADWRALVALAHSDKPRAFERYAAFYLSTSGQTYWSDMHQLSVYLDGYHGELDRSQGTGPATEAITELYVPRASLADFLSDARALFRAGGAEVIYGTIRLIERDDETALAWARESWACVVFNLHTPHDGAGRARSAWTFRRLVDLAVRQGGSFYLTYGRHATRAQVIAAYPGFERFIEAKRAYDPEERFTSEWYRHYARPSAQAWRGRADQEQQAQQPETMPAKGLEQLEHPSVVGADLASQRPSHDGREMQVAGRHGVGIAERQAHRHLHRPGAAAGDRSEDPPGLCEIGSERRVDPTRVPCGGT